MNLEHMHGRNQIELHMTQSFNPSQALPYDNRRKTHHPNGMTRLGDQGRGSGGLVLEGRGQLLLLDVVSSETVDPGLDKNQSAVVDKQC